MDTLKQQTKSVMERLLEMLNTRNFDMASEIYATDYCAIDIASHTRVQGPQEAAHTLERVFLAFPDLQFSVEQTLFDGDCVVVYWTARGTHQAVVFHLPPTGRPVQVNGITMLRAANERLTQGIHMWDMASLLRSVGLLPEVDESTPSETLDFQDAFQSLGFGNGNLLMGKAFQSG